MASFEAGMEVMRITTIAPLLGYFPVAAHFKLFDALVELGTSATSEDVLEVCKQRLPASENAASAPGLTLIKDSLHAMAGLGLIDSEADNAFSPNSLTKHLAAHQSAIHGGIHFTSEMLMAASFLFPMLKATNFKYPFRECETPMQYAHKLMGNEEYSKKHAYAIMSDEGRMDSFNSFMDGKFFKSPSSPERLNMLQYDLGAVLESAPPTAIKMVDIGGSRGELLLELKEAFPQLQDKDLVVEEFNDDLGDVPGITQVQWNFKDESSPQPIKGALIYHLSHVLHNLPDLDAVRLLQRIGEAMEPHSRILIHELAKGKEMAMVHVAMVILFGGRERTAEEYRKLAEAAGLKVTFEAFPPFGDGVIELMKPEAEESLCRETGVSLCREPTNDRSSPVT